MASGFKEVVGPGLEKLIRDLDIIREENSDYQLKDLAITGDDLIKRLKISQGPLIGKALNALLEKVIESPELNEKAVLLKIAGDLIV